MRFKSLFLFPVALVCFSASAEEKSGEVTRKEIRQERRQERREVRQDRRQDRREMRQQRRERRK